MPLDRRKQSSSVVHHVRPSVGIVEDSKRTSSSSASAISRTQQRNTNLSAKSSRSWKSSVPDKKPESVNKGNRSTRSNLSSDHQNDENQENPSQERPYAISVVPAPRRPPAAACQHKDRSGQTYRVARKPQALYNPGFHEYSPSRPPPPCRVPLCHMRHVFHPGPFTTRPAAGGGECMVPATWSEGETTTCPQWEICGDLQDVGISKVNCSNGSVDVLKDRRTLPNICFTPQKKIPAVLEACCCQKIAPKPALKCQKPALKCPQPAPKPAQPSCNCQPQARDKVQHCKYIPPSQGRGAFDEKQLRLFFGCIRYFLSYGSCFGVVLTVFTAVIWYMCVFTLGKYPIIFGIVLMSFLLAFRGKKNLLSFVDSCCKPKARCRC